MSASEDVRYKDRGRLGGSRKIGDPNGTTVALIGFRKGDGGYVPECPRARSEKKRGGAMKKRGKVEAGGGKRLWLGKKKGKQSKRSRSLLSVKGLQITKNGLARESKGEGATRVSIFWGVQKSRGKKKTGRRTSYARQRQND